MIRPMSVCFRPRVLAAIFAAAILPAGTLLAQQVLYVGNDNPSGGVQQYTLPISPSSTPNFTFAASNTVSVGVDGSGNVAIGDFTGNLKFFTAPISGASTPAASFVNGAGPNTGQIIFNPAGQMFASTFGAAVNRFTPPFTNATTPSQSITAVGLTASAGIVFDSSQNLYVANSSGPGSNLFVFAPPYTSASVITPAASGTAYRKIAISGSQLFAASVSPGVGKVDVYNLPLTNASTPAFSITSGIDTPEGLAVDASGRLHVGNLGSVSGSVVVYTGPFSAASVPTTTLPFASGFSIFGIAIGVTSAAVSGAVPALGMTGLIALCAALAAAALIAMRTRT
jgi:hypothetical protein